MKKRWLPFVFPLALVLTACSSEPEQEMAIDEAVDDAEIETPVVQTASWSYGGETGPQDWGLMSEEYAVCSDGVEQSPIDVRTDGVEATDLPGLEFAYGEGEFLVEDIGLGFKATPQGEHRVMIGDQEYRLLQFHAHTPSEHTIDGESFPMEIHFVHQNDAGELAVIGTMVREGDSNGEYAPVVEAAAQGGGTADVGKILSLLPNHASYFTYPGSLTTPPCSEGVRWILLSDPITLGSDQIAVFADAHGATNRPVQPLGDRVVRGSR